MRSKRSAALLALACLLIVAKGQDAEADCVTEIKEIVSLKKALDAAKTKAGALHDQLGSCKSTKLALQRENDELMERSKEAASSNSQAQLAEEELELVRKELTITQERLALELSSGKGHQSREHTCTQDLELAKAEAKAAQGRVAEAEKALRDNDCSAIRKDLFRYRDRAEEAEVGKETLARRLAEVEGRTKHLAELERGAAAAGTLETELAETRHTLASLLASLEARRQYDQLLQQHEREWLPHWLSLRWAEARGAAAAGGGAAAAACARLCAAAGRRLAPIIRGGRSVGNKLYELQLKPALAKAENAVALRFGAAWPSLKRSVGNAAAALGAAVGRAAAAVGNQIFRAEGAAEQAVLARMQRVESLKPMARHAVVHFWLWGLLSTLTAPLVYIVAARTIRALVHVVRAGSAEVVPPAVGAALNAVEEKLGHSFSQSETLRAAFADPRGRLAWLGTAAARMLASEAAFRGGGAAHGSFLLQREVDRRVCPAALAAAAAKAGLREHVKAGPGARSEAAAAARSGQLYAACLGAAYVDAGHDLNAVHKAWGLMLPTA